MLKQQKERQYFLFKRQNTNLNLIIKHEKANQYVPYHISI